MKVPRLILTVLLAVPAMAGSPYQLPAGKPTEFMKDGGWCWFEDPRAIIHDGKLIMGVISGVSGDMRVGVYDLEANKPLGVAVLDPGFEKDDHNTPVFHVRNDGSLLAVWAMHGKENRHYYSISSPTNYLSWSERKIHTHNYEIPEGQKWWGVTYMNLYTNKSQGLLYNFYRSGLTYNPSFVTSADDGTTWGKDNHFVMDEVEGRARPYARYLQLNENSVAISFTDAHPRDFGNSIYYASFDGTSYRRADGTKIKDLSDGPLKPSEAEKIYARTGPDKKPPGYGSFPNAGWTCDLEKDGKDRPFIGYTVYLNPSDIRFHLANWTGKRWNDREIAYAGKGLYEREDSYSGLLALDPENPSKLFISTDVDPATGKSNGGMHEIYMAQLSDTDKTGTIQWTPVTSGSKNKNIRPIVVAGEGYKVVLWLAGPWRHFQDFESDIVGYVLEQPTQ